MPFAEGLDFLLGRAPGHQLIPHFFGVPKHGHKGIAALSPAGDSLGVFVQPGVQIVILLLRNLPGGKGLVNLPPNLPKVLGQLIPVIGQPESHLGMDSYIPLVHQQGQLLGLFRDLAVGKDSG